MVSEIGSPDEESNAKNGDGDEQFDEEKMWSNEDVFTKIYIQFLLSNCQ